MIQTLWPRPPTFQDATVASLAWQPGRADCLAALDVQPSSQRQPSQAIIRAPAIREVLVALDGSAYAEHALPWAIRIAELAKTQVRLVHVHEPMDQAFHGRRANLYKGFDQILKKPKEEYLADLMRRLARADVISVKPMLLEGRSVASTLAALTVAADLLVMATPPRSRLGRLLFGSVSQAVLQETSTPLLLVRGYKRPADLAARPPLRHALVPLDGSPEAEYVLPTVAALSQLTGGQLTLLGVLPEMAPFANMAQGPPKALVELIDVAQRWKPNFPQLRTNVVWSDSQIAPKVLQQAQILEADFIGVVTRRRGRLRRFLEPGLVDYLMRYASVPVLVVKRKSE